MKLVYFAGSSNGKKTVTFYHGDHLDHPPPIITNWSHVSMHWLKHAPVGQWFMDGDKISNYKHQWVIGVVKENGA